MKLALYSNYLNHHQVLITDELYELLGNEFIFIATLPRDKRELKGGIDYSDRPYCILAGEDEKAHEKAMQLAREADVCVFGACSQEYAKARAINNKRGLSFEMGERWLKRGWINIFSSHLIKWWFNYMRYFHHKPFYKLCNSAFTATDDRKLFAYRGRHYKWGYFTAVDDTFKFETSKEDVSNSGTCPHKLMWCSRFLNLKHPELPIRMAAKLKEKGYWFVLDMYGSGKEEYETKQLAHNLGVDDVVRFHGALPNIEILQAMREHEIFLFTSNKFEGWGAVANEAMTNGCALVTSDAIGSTPYLVKDGKNGCIFKSGNADSLTKRVEWLICNPEKKHAIRHEARRTMLDTWSPSNAAKALLNLIDDLQNNRKCSIKEGPCSEA